MGEHGDRPQLTVVIPSFQSAEWLPSTLAACFVAVARSPWTTEVVVVDDGSTDGTAESVQRLAATAPVPVRLVRQANQGRFLARWAGLQDARGDLVLLLDSRVLLDPGSLAHVAATLADRPSSTVWNGHCTTDPEAPLVGHFWEVITYTFWGRYLGHPAPVEFGLADFNRYPKGTGVFLAPRELLVEACRTAWPTGDAALASDDTKLIRFIAATRSIRLDPGFAAVYRPRTDVRAFARHSFGRGTFLVDSFAGTSAVWNAALVLLAAAPVVDLALVATAVATGTWWLVAVLLGAQLAGIAAPAALAAARGCPARGVRAYLCYAGVFAGPYWAGLVRGLSVHGHLLRSTRRNTAPRSPSTPVGVAR